MLALLAALGGALLLGGFLTLVLALIPHVPQPRRVRQQSVWLRRLRRMSRTTRLLLMVGFGVGVVLALLTGWVVALVIAPALIAGIPALLSPPAARAEINRLQALEEWTRGLSGILISGVGLEEALRVSLRSTPAALKPQVTRLVAALQGRKPTEEALLDFADDLDDVTGDLVASFLILGARRRAGGLADVLQALAESVAADVRARRRIESDREKPRSTARLVTLISAGAMGVLFLTGRYVAAYSSPMGQALLLLYIGMYLGLLVWMRVMTMGTPPPRFLKAKTKTPDNVTVKEQLA